MPISDAYIDDIRIECETIEDSWDKAIVRHEVPYAMGAITQDMGGRARTVKLRCYFWDEGGHETYAGHASLVEKITGPDGLALHELRHPVYGVLSGRVETINVRADDRMNTAEVDLTFVEHLRKSVKARTYRDVASAAEKTFTLGQAQAMLAAANALVDTIGEEAAQIINTPLTTGMTLVGQFATLSMRARGILGTIDTALATSESLLASVTIPVTSVISAIDYGAALPGKIAGTLARTAVRYAETLDAIKTEPAQAIHKLKSGLAEIEANFDDTDFPMKKSYRIMAGMTLGLYSAYRYAEDEDRRDAVRASEEVDGFDITGQRIDYTETSDIMTVNEMEATLYDIRGYIQDILDDNDGARVVVSLKEFARILAYHINEIKIERDRVVEIETANNTPLVALCLGKNIGYRKLDRIFSLNGGLKNPTFLDGTVNVYAE